MSRKDTKRELNQKLLKAVELKLIQMESVDPNCFHKGFGQGIDIDAILIDLDEQFGWSQLVIVAEHGRMRVHASDGTVKTDDFLGGVNEVDRIVYFVDGFILGQQHTK